MAKHKYDSEYMKCGLSYIKDRREQKPQCVLYSDVLAQESMKLSKLKWHLETKHTSHKDKPVELSFKDDFKN